MSGGSLLTMMSCALLAVTSPPTSGLRFLWHPGQVLTYRLEQVTHVAEMVEGNKAETSSKLATKKRWEVTDVDAAGAATFRLTLLALRIETTSPGGETILFDSSAPDKSTPQMREQMAKYVGQVMAIIRVDPSGRVIEVKESKFAPASRFESEPPFGLVLPENKADPAWERTYQITLEPPQGTGEKFQAVQTYKIQSQDEHIATIALSTLIKSPPAAAADQIPLLQVQPEGSITFDVQAGVMRSARLKIDKELKDHQGKGSTYHFQSEYSEDLLP